MRESVKTGTIMTMCFGTLMGVMSYMQAGGSVGQDSQQAVQQPGASDAPLPAESPALKEDEVNADNGGTEFDAEAADSQTPVGAQG